MIIIDNINFLRESVNQQVDVFNGIIRIDMKKIRNNFSNWFAVVVIVVSSTFVSRSFSMVYDNRFIPLLQRPYIRVPCANTYLSVAPFFAYSDKSWCSKDNEQSLLEIYGCFDQGALGNAFRLVKGCNPITDYNPEWKGPIGWIIDGKIQAQGISFSGEHRFKKWLSIGFYSLFMHVNSSIDFIRNLDPQHDSICGNATEEDKIALDRIRRQMFKELCLSCGHSSQFGFGDIDLYFRLGWEWDYAYKFRHIDVGLRIGALLGTGQTRQINDPLSIPFGGNGHYGVYISADGEFEVKEDLIVGLLFRVSKRFARTYRERMPVCQKPSEFKVPQNFAVEVGNVQVNPGATFVFSPYVIAENVRDGLGFRLQYTLTHHQKDHWTDKRPTAKKGDVSVDLKEVEKLSVWGSDYVSLTAFYDFGKARVCRGYEPILSLTWDLPTTWLASQNVSQTQKLTIGLEFNF